MVREYILTDRERGILKRFLDSGERLEGFASIVWLLRRVERRLKGDLELIEAVLERVKEQS